MGIFDKIIGKKKEEKKAVPTPSDVKTGKKPVSKKEKAEPGKGKKEEVKEKKETTRKEVRIKKVAKKDENMAYEVIFEPLVTEKSANLGQFNKYVFKVEQKASKNQIRTAIQDFYGVGVVAVNIVKIHPKKRIHGRTVGYKKGYKKAIVTLQSGDTIGVVEGV